MILVKTEKKSNSLVCRQQLIFGQNSFREPQQTFPQSLKSMHRLIINHSSVIVFWHKTSRLNELEKKKFPNILALKDPEWSLLNIKDCSWIEWCHFYDLEFLWCVNMPCILCINELKLLHWSFFLQEKIPDRIDSSRPRVLYRERFEFQ